MKSQTLRVLVVDDSGFMRARIKRDLESAGMDVVGEARNGLEAAQCYASLRPDLVTMDITMRDGDGMCGTRGILSLDPKAKIVLFSIVDDKETMQRAILSGALACVHKTRPRELIDCLRQIAKIGRSA